MFKQNESGGVMAIFALTLPVLMASMAAAVEITRATAYKQRLTSATELACNQGSIYVSAQRKVDLLKDYRTDVSNIVNTNVSQKELTDVSVGTPVITAANLRVTTSGSLSYVLGSFLPSSSIRFDVSRDCAIVTNVAGPSELLFSESFEVGHSVSRNSWDVLKNWNNWSTTNAGVEINGQPSLSGNTVRNGNFFAELDSDCNTWANRGVSNCRANSAMTLVRNNLSAGDYEVRYYYISRKGYIDTSGYGTAPICSDQTKPQGAQRDNFVTRAQTEPSVRKANDDGQTFKIEVYVDKSTDNLFTSTNLADTCIWADTWIERKINFTINNAGDYRISWRAAGREDTFGGLIDYLRFCRGTCP